MKKRLFAAIVLMACLAVSCQKNEEELPTFEARTESGNAKTELVGSIIQWVSGDQVKVFGDFGYAIYGVTPRGDNPTWATLIPIENHGITGFLPYRFVYPASMAEGGTSNNNTLYVEYPQQRSLSDAPMKHFAMYGESDHHDVSFINLGGMLKIHLQKDSTTIREVIIKANENFAGRYSIAHDNTTNPLSGGQYNEISISGEVIDISEGHDVYISLPAGTYSGMSITILNTAFDSCIVTSSEETSVVIERSRMSSINLNSMTFDHINTHAWFYWDNWADHDYYTILRSCDLIDMGLPSGTKWADTHIEKTYDSFMSNGTIMFINGQNINYPTSEQISELSNYCSKSVIVESGTRYLVFTSTINNNQLRIPVSFTNREFEDGIPSDYYYMVGNLYLINGIQNTWIEAYRYFGVEDEYEHSLNGEIYGPWDVSSDVFDYDNYSYHLFVVRNGSNSN